MEKSKLIETPLEILTRALIIFKKKEEFKNRKTMINIDNSIEIGIKNFLNLDYKTIYRFPKILNMLQQKFPDKITSVEINKILSHHKFRNILLHNGNGLTVEDYIAYDYLLFAIDFLSRLYNQNLEYLLLQYGDGELKVRWDFFLQMKEMKNNLKLNKFLDLLKKIEMNQILIYQKFKKYTTILSRGSIFRRSDYLLPITIYLCLKNNIISFSEDELVNSSQISKKDLKHFINGLLNQLPKYAKKHNQSFEINAFKSKISLI
jgi:hypothetical protein